jgi:putative ABC transport system permease protein
MNIILVALKNVKRNTLRSTAIIAAIAVLSGVLISLTLIYSALNHSIELSGRRLGADAMIVPAEYAGKTQDILMTGNPGSFTMRDSLSLREEIIGMDDVQAVSAQLFVVSAPLSCCAVSETMLIGYEPESDFAITPWVKEHIGGERLAADAIVVGANILAGVEDRLKFYGQEFLVVGKLEPTGMRFIDSGVFIPMAGIRSMVSESGKKALTRLSIKPNDISSLLIKLKDGANPEQFAMRYENEHPDQSVLVMSGVLGSAKKHLIAPLKGMVILTVLQWVVSLILIGLIYKLTIDERRYEIGVMKALGAGKAEIWRILLMESFLLSGVGGLSGIMAGVAVVKTFSGILAITYDAPLILPALPTLFLSAAAVLAASLCSGTAASIFAIAKWADVEPFYLMKGGRL